MATPKSSRTGAVTQALTRDELLALPAVIDLDTANRALALGRSTGYALAKRGQYPVKVLRFGNAYRVPTADLLRVLGMTAPEVPEDREPPRANAHKLCA
ncbi:hypothetical protein ACFXJ5_09570 [Streptomyces sp. NPDC059373]